MPGPDSPHRRPAGQGDDAAFLESIPGIFWEADPETLRFEWVSSQAERILGYPTRRWIEEPDFWVEHMHPEDREWAPGFCADAVARREAHEFEYRMIAADGRTVWLRDMVHHFERDGRLRIRGVMFDVTGHKATEEELREANARISQVMSGAPVILFATDAEGTITYCQGRGLAMAGIDPARLLGRKASDWGDNSEDVQGYLRRAFAGESFSVRIHFAGRYYLVSYSPVRDARGEVEGVIGCSTDVTEQVQSQHERERLEAQVQHGQKLESLGVLAGGIAHDFNNLLMTILGSADLALADLPEPEPARPHVERLQRAARSAAGLTRQLLAYSGQAPFETSRVDLSRLVSEMVDLLKVSISKKASLELDLAASLPPIEADPAQITQVILNLITNASDALDGRSGSIRVRTGRMHLDRDHLSQAYLPGSLGEGPYVVLEVSDTGAGMDEETRSRIFDPFFTTKFPGRGLGLATVLGIVRAHDGTVSVYSEPGRGTLFRVLLPCSDAEREAPAPPPVREGWSGAGTVLVVDDEDDVRELAEEFVRRLGFEVIAARDGSEALERFRAHAGRIGAVLLDVTMPEMSGEEVVRELNVMAPEMPVVLMSGFSEQYTESKLEGVDVAGFLQKPFSPEDLAAVLQRVLPE